MRKRLKPAEPHAVAIFVAAVGEVEISFIIRRIFGPDRIATIGGIYIL